MTRINPLFGIFAIAFLVPAAYAETPEESQAQCEQYALEDKVPADEMKDYMAECLKQMADESTEVQPAKDE
jgi:hypothetical protein